MSTGVERDRALAAYDILDGPPRRELVHLTALDGHFGVNRR